MDARGEQRSDREIVMAAVKQNGLALCYAAELLRGDHEIVMQAVTQNGFAIQHATKESTLGSTRES